jgi:tripartite-type tricarboxylate transporter receptor subunit TctC
MKLARTLAILVLCAVSAVQAQVYPSKPLRMVVGFPPGGGNDIVARIVAARLQERMGQPVVVENRPGNAGVIGAEVVAKAAPDGYTLYLGSTGNAIAPSIQARLPYDPVNGFAPVGVVGIAPSVIVVNSEVPVRSMAELIALAKSRPGKLTYASSGNGTTLHLGGELLKSMAGIDLVHVPYKGNAQALADVVGGQVSMIISALPPALPLATAGKVRIIAATTRERIRALPDLPTVAEQGVAGYEIFTWYGVFATGGSPAAVIERLGAELRNAVADPGVRDQLDKQGVDATGSSSPAEFRAFYLAEIEKWARAVRLAGIKAD